MKKVLLTVTALVFVFTNAFAQTDLDSAIKEADQKSRKAEMLKAKTKGVENLLHRHAIVGLYALALKDPMYTGVLETLRGKINATAEVQVSLDDIESLLIVISQQSLQNGPKPMTLLNVIAAHYLLRDFLEKNDQFIYKSPKALKLLYDNWLELKNEDEEIAQEMKEVIVKEKYVVAGYDKKLSYKQIVKIIKKENPEVEIPTVADYN